jgi:hypothetical protein
MARCKLAVKRINGAHRGILCLRLLPMNEDASTPGSEGLYKAMLE